MATDTEHDRVDEWMFRCYGATTNISARLQTIRKYRDFIRMITWGIPTVVLALASWLGPQSVVFQDFFWVSGGVGVIVALALVVDHFSFEANEKKLQHLYDENMKLTLRAQTLQRLKETDFKAEVRGFYDACETLSLREQNEFTWTAQEDRAAVRAALFNFQAVCNRCTNKPQTRESPAEFKENTHCSNCGERLIL